MAKLQSIKRTNGSTVFSVNIPLDCIEEVDWKKGDELTVYVSPTNNIIISKDEV